MNSSLLSLGYTFAWRGGMRCRTPESVLRAVFTDHYQELRKTDAESVSGPGSTLERAAAFTAELRELFTALGIRTLLDAPCGDFNWMSAAGLELESYVGADIVTELIARNRRMFGAPGRDFIACDFTRDPLPRADLILCRDALVHLSFTDIAAALRNFRASGSRYLLTTTFTDIGSNDDVATGGWRTLNLQAPPFGFPAPLALIDEHCLHSGGIYRGKCLGLWELSSLSSPKEREKQNAEF